jgi:hypothetical protein
MKLTTLTALFSTVLVTNASILPGFILQNEDLGTTMLGDSTKLITNCGTPDDILT